MFEGLLHPQQTRVQGDLRQLPDDPLPGGHRRRGTHHCIMMM